MPGKQLLKHMAKRREDALADIPHPDGRGLLTCGMEALRRFDQITDRFLDSEPTLTGRIDRAKARKKVIEAFVTRVLREKKDVDAATVESILKDAQRECEESLRTVQNSATASSGQAFARLD